MTIYWHNLLSSIENYSFNRVFYSKVYVQEWPIYHSNLLYSFPHFPFAYIYFRDIAKAFASIERRNTFDS